MPAFTLPSLTPLLLLLATTTTTTLALPSPPQPLAVTPTSPTRNLPLIPFPRNYQPEDVDPQQYCVDKTMRSQPWNVTGASLSPSTTTPPIPAAPFTSNLPWTTAPTSELSFLVDNIAVDTHFVDGARPRPNETACSWIADVQFAQHDLELIQTTSFTFYPHIRYAFSFTVTDAVQRAGMFLSSAGERVWSVGFEAGVQRAVVEFALEEEQEVIFVLDSSRGGSSGSMAVFHLGP